MENDGDVDLVVASGGNEYTGTALPLTQRIYRNDGKGNFQRDTLAIPKIYMTAGTVAAIDFNQDGYVDLFLEAELFPGIMVKYLRPIY